MTAATLLGLSIFASGLTWTAIFARLRQGEPPLAERMQRHDVWNPVATGIVLLWLIIQLAAQAQTAISGASPEPDLRAVQATCAINLALVAVLVAILAWSPGATLADYGINLPDNLREAAAGIGGLFASILPTFGLIALSRGFRSEQTMHPFLKLLVDNPSPSTIVWLTFAAVAAAPLAEELAFRVVLQRAFCRVTTPTVAIVVVALIFSVVHGWPDALPLVPLALILGYVYQRRNSYLSVVLLHASFNAFNLLLALLAGEAEDATAIALGG